MANSKKKKAQPSQSAKHKAEELVRFVTCDECGNEQGDMGRNVACEECGYLMPTNEKN